MTSPAPRPGPWPAPDPAAIPPQIEESILRHAHNCLPYEACGLLAVDPGGTLVMAYPLTNAHASPTSFTIEPTEHFGALLHAERHGWEIGGVFHSHPRGPAVPSPTDLAQPHDPTWLHVIAAFDPHPHLRAWRFHG